VTLLFFDETGTLRGPATPARVEAAIAAHLR